MLQLRRGGKKNTILRTKCLLTPILSDNYAVGAVTRPDIIGIAVEKPI